MITRAKVLFVAIAAILFGGFLCPDAFRVIRALGAPIVVGDIVARAPTSRWSIPSAEFTIRIQGSGEEVRACTGRYLLNTVPQTARFHYTGDPTRQVFLFEHEENPVWIILTCWCGAAFLLLLWSPWRRLGGVRRDLGWSGEGVADAELKR